MCNNSKLFSMIFLGSLALFSSCGDKNDDPEDQKQGNDYVAPKDWAEGSAKRYVENPDEIQTVKVQQLQIEGTAIALANHHKSVNFKDVIDVIRYANDNYIDKDGYKDDAVSDFFDNAMDLLTTVNKNPIKESGETYEYISKYYYYDYNNSEFDQDKYYIHRYEEKVNGYFIKLFKASSFYTHFYAGEKGWVEEPGNYNDLQFTFNDKDGKLCVLSAKASGKEQIVHVTRDNDWDYYDEFGYEVKPIWVEKDTVLTYETWTYNPETGEERREEKSVKVDGYYLRKTVESYDVNDIQVSVPEKVVMTLTREGNTLISTEVNLNLAGIENNRININKTNLGLTTKTKISGTEIVVNKFDYKNGEKSDYSIYSTINGKKLYEISGEFLSNIDFKGDQNYQYIEDLLEEVFEDYDTNIKNFTGIVCNVNFLGELQVKAAVSDAKKVISLFDDAEDHDTDENYYKSKIDEINKYLNMGLYYYGGSTLQAKIRLEAFQDEDEEWWYSENGEYGHTSTPYWYAEPVIEFDGGQTYSMDDYFNEDDFRKLVDLIEEIGDDYEDQLDF